MTSARTGPDGVTDAVVRILDESPELCVERWREGQVMLYPGHRPPGLFLVVDGELWVSAPDMGVSRPESAEDGPFLVPACDEVDRPSGALLTCRTDLAVVFVPLSLVQEGGSLCDRLTDDVRQVPLARGAAEEEDAT